MKKANLLIYFISVALCIEVSNTFTVRPTSPIIHDASNTRALFSKLHNNDDLESSFTNENISWNAHIHSRRHLLKSIQRKTIIGSLSTLLISSSAVAKEVEKTDDQSSGDSLVSAETIAQRLKEVPTFTIVDKAGAPYAVVGEDAKLSTYFFTTYEEAKRILTSAKQSFEKAKATSVREANEKRAKKKMSPLSPKEIEDEFGKNPWNYARISSVNLDLAVSLSIKASGKRTGAYFFVQSAEDDVEDALSLSKDGKKNLAEGKVPLFYFEDMKITSDGKAQSPVYFQKSQLINEWKRQNPQKKEKDMPEILVSELFSVIYEMARPGGTNQDLKTIVFVPPTKSRQKADECNKLGKGEAPFKLGERIIVL